MNDISNTISNTILTPNSLFKHETMAVLTFSTVALLSLYLISQCMKLNENINKNQTNYVNPIIKKKLDDKGILRAYRRRSSDPNFNSKENNELIQGDKGYLFGIKNGK